MRYVAVVFLLCVGALSGCTTRYLDFMPDEEALYESPLEDVWPHVRTFFEANDFRYREDPGSFVLETEWREEFGGSRVSGFWHRYLVIGKRDTPTRSKLWVIRNTRSANEALKAPGSELSWGVSRGLGTASNEESPLQRYGSAEAGD